MCICCSGINYFAVSIHIDDFIIIIVRFYFLLFITIYWLFLILAPINAFAEDKIYTCKIVVGGYPHPKHDGKFYIEAEHEEKTPMLDAMPTSQILINDEGIFYKNNPNRQFETLVTYEKFVEAEGSEVIKELEETLSNWDKMLELENFQTFYLPYKAHENEIGYTSLKRISINKKNNRTSEITVPAKGELFAYFFLRICEGENENDSIQVDFQEGLKRKLS